MLVSIYKKNYLSNPNSLSLALNFAFSVIKISVFLYMVAHPPLKSADIFHHQVKNHVLHNLL